MRATCFVAGSLCLIVLTMFGAAATVQTRGEPPEIEVKRDGQEPTAPEQALIYLLNKARHDPTKYGKSLGLDLSAIRPAPPLALNQELTAAAHYRASDMADRKYFSHIDPDGIGPNWHVLESGYKLGRRYPRTKNANTVESIYAGSEAPETALAQLVIDRSDPESGHRKHLLGATSWTAAARDIGVGLARAGPGPYRAFTAIHTARTDDEIAYITGVVFRDKNGNRAYDAGEGLKNVTVSAGDQSVSTMQHGGFVLPARPGSVEIVCEKSPFQGRATAVIAMQRRNVHVEFLSGRRSGVVNFGEPEPAPSDGGE